VELLHDEAFTELFHRYRMTAFHLELKDSYHTPEEAGPLSLFLEGRQDDFAWHEPWLRLVRQVTGSGRRIERVRVISEPHVDYTRWGLTVARLNVEAGEDIRWLPRRLTTDLQLSTDDFWLFDDERVVFTIFEPGGRFGGGAQTVDPVIVEHCRRARDQVWDRAVPHRKYVSG
jgi:hypothetical protein